MNITRKKQSEYITTIYTGKGLGNHQFWNLSAEYLEKSVENLLLHPENLDLAAQDLLLAEETPVFTVEDNDKLLMEPTKIEVYNTVSASNLYAAPGTDGLTSYF